MIIIAPHKKKSRTCKKRDLKRIERDSPEMAALCYQKIGLYMGGLAVAHCQVTEKDPLRFFVTKEGDVFINPRIIHHTNDTVDSVEGCMSFADREEITVQRYNKVHIQYDNTDFKEKQELNTGGKLAKVIQHEIEHFDGKYIYVKQGMADGVSPTAG